MIMTSSICRGCGLLTTAAIVNIFNKQHRKILEKFRYLTNIKIEKCDGLPELLCTKCIEQLQLSYKFKLRCIILDGHFRQTKQDSETDYDAISSPDFNDYKSDDNLISVDANEKDNFIITDEVQHIKGEYEYIDNNAYSIKEKEYEKFIEIDENEIHLDEIDENEIHLDEIDENEIYLDEIQEDKNYTFIDLLQSTNDIINQEEIQIIECSKLSNCNNIYSCGKCEKKFATFNQLNEHFQEIHQSSDKINKDIQNTSDYHVVETSVDSCEKNVYSCLLCTRDYKTLRRLKKHHLIKHESEHLDKEHTYNIKVDKKKRKYLCPNCGKESTGLSVHHNHMRTHTNERPYECKICKMKFKFVNNLTNHNMIHTGEKPFRCEICPLTFRQSQQLKSHQLVHSGIKSHKCKFCVKTFALKGNLVIHERIHTGELPYLCKECGRGFADLNGLKRHRHRSK